MPEITPARVSELLEALGDTPHKIAKSLRTLGVTGEPGEPDRCPIAAYLRKHEIPADVCDDVVCWFDEMTGESGDADASAPIQGFIKKFDGGGYRFLRAVKVPE